MAKTKKQLKIPGTERAGIAEVNAAAERYVEVRDERMKLTEDETEAHEALVAVMKRSAAARLEAIVRRVIREELAPLLARRYPGPSARVKRRCATPGCLKSTQTASPFCSDCRAGRSPTWKHPRLRRIA